MNAKEVQNGPVAWSWLAVAFAAAVLITQFFLERGENQYLRAIGIVCLLLSPVFIFPPFLLLTRHGGRQRGKPYYSTTTLVDHGVYSIVRHPQYLGYVLFTLGFAALSQHRLTSVLAGCSAIAFYLQSLGEETLYRKRSGQDYLEYMRRVPRFNFVAGFFRYVFLRQRKS